MALRDEWNGFTGGHWVDDINVRDFIQRNYTEYTVADLTNDGLHLMGEGYIVWRDAVLPYVK